MKWRQPCKILFFSLQLRRYSCSWCKSRSVICDTTFPSPSLCSLLAISSLSLAILFSCAVPPPPNCSSSTRRTEHRLVLWTCANQSHVITEIIPSGEKLAVGGADSSHFLGNCGCPGESASETLSRALLRFFFFSYPCCWAVFKTGQTQRDRQHDGTLLVLPKATLVLIKNARPSASHHFGFSSIICFDNFFDFFFFSMHTQTVLTLQKPQKETKMQLIPSYVRSDTGCCFFTASYWSHCSA